VTLHRFRFVFSVQKPNPYPYDTLQSKISTWISEHINGQKAKAMGSSPIFSSNKRRHNISHLITFSSFPDQFGSTPPSPSWAKGQLISFSRFIPPNSSNCSWVTVDLGSSASNGRLWQEGFSKRINLAQFNIIMLGIRKIPGHYK